jgi:hypothetical protein
MSYTVSAADLSRITINESETVRSVLQCVKMVLTTAKGSVPMYREFGLDMSILDRPTSVAEPRARTMVREAVERWEPRATVKSVTFQRDEAQGRLIPTVEVEIAEQ